MENEIDDDIIEKEINLGMKQAGIDLDIHASDLPVKAGETIRFFTANVNTLNPHEESGGASAGAAAMNTRVASLCCESYSCEKFDSVDK